MQFLRQNAKYFVMGFLLAFLMFHLSSCPHNSVAPADEKETYQEQAQLREFTASVENAFRSGIADSVIKLTIQDYQAASKAYLSGASPEQMTAFAEAFKNRKLVFANERYAEYELQANDHVFTIAFCRPGDGNWQLMRY